MSELNNKVLGKVSVVGAQVSGSGRHVFVVNRKMKGRRGLGEQASISADPHYWDESPDRVNALWERLAPKIKLAPGKRVDSDDEEDDLADAA